MSGRFAVGAYFFLHGVVSSSWVYTTAMFTSRFVVNPDNLGEGLTIGMVVLLSVVLVPVGMPLGAWLVGQVGARRVAAGAAVTGSLVLGGSAFAGSVGVLALAMVVLGLANGALLVAMNTLAAGIERKTGRLVLPWCHGWLALGGLAGGVLAVQLVRAYVPQIDQLLWTAAVSLVLAVGFAKLLPDVDLPDTRPRLPRNFVLLTVVAFVALVAADVVRSSSWRFNGMATGIPAAVFNLVGAQAFALGMALGGFAGGLVAARIGLRNLLNVGAGTMVLGLVWLNLSSRLDVAAVGFLVAGAGLSCVFPVMLSLAAKQGSARHAIAAISAIGYIAAEAGSRLFGLLGYVLDLEYSLAYLLLVPVVVVVAGSALTASDRAGT